MQTGHTSILQIFIYHFRGPLSTRPIPCPILSKLKLISPSLVQATRLSPMTKKTHNIFIWPMPLGPLYWYVWFKYNTFIWVTPPGLICWFVWLEGMLQGIYRAHGAHKIHVLPMWDWEWDWLEVKYCLLRVGHTKLSSLWTIKSLKKYKYLNSCLFL